MAKEVGGRPSGFWSVRDDLPAPRGWRPLAEYNPDHADLYAFLSDCPVVERLRMHLERFLGTAQEPSPLIDGL